MRDTVTRPPVVAALLVLANWVFCAAIWWSLDDRTFAAWYAVAAGIGFPAAVGLAEYHHRRARRRDKP